MKEFIAIASLAAIWLVIIISNCIKAGELNEIQQFIPKLSAYSLQQMKQDCENDLPRSQQCVIVVSAQVVKEK